MAIYKLLNYSPSPVAFSTKERSYMADGGSIEEPNAVLLDEKELIEANYNSHVFKDGFLFPEDRCAEEVYKLLLIDNWQNILKDGDIRDIIMHPTAEGLRRLLTVESSFAFGRIWGMLAMLRISGEDVPNQSSRVITARKDEIDQGIRQSHIVVKDIPKDIKVQNDELKSENDELRAKNDALMAELEKLRAASAEVKAPVKPSSSTAAKKKPASTTKG